MKVVLDCWDELTVPECQHGAHFFCADEFSIYVSSWLDAIPNITACAEGVDHEVLQMPNRLRRRFGRINCLSRGREQAMMINMNLWKHDVLENLASDVGVATSARNIEMAGGPFATWERLASPEGPCQRYLESALYIGFADFEHELSKRFLGWAVETALRALGDPRFAVESENRSKGWKNKPAFPGNQGEVKAVWAIASAMQQGTPLDLSLLREAADQITESALANKGKDWAEQPVQGRYLLAVRLRMICGDWAHARKALDIKRKFDAVMGQHQVLSHLLDALLTIGASEDLRSRESVHRFENYFDLIRVPEGKPIINSDSGSWVHGYRIEMALIRERVLYESAAFPNWNRVFASVGQSVRS
ncbi:hypothetical protein [Roseateles chitinivorans]|uniref:hypothetical protein n=1 Tax=Roseateles chitinivorans TaxID=2917965 RepID=UPI00117FBCF4|nr:hypothetical protein [Roseateles chitinivorans]